MANNIRPASLFDQSFEPSALTDVQYSQIRERLLEIARDLQDNARNQLLQEWEKRPLASPFVKDDLSTDEGKIKACMRDLKEAFNPDSEKSRMREDNLPDLLRQQDALREFTEALAPIDNQLKSDEGFSDVE